MRIPAIGIALWLAWLPQAGDLRATSPTQRSSTLSAVLANRQIWAPGFADALRQMPAWASLRETEIVVHQTRIVGSREFDRLEAGRAAATIEEGLHTRTLPRERKIDQWWGPSAGSGCGEWSVNVRPRNARVVLEAAAGCELLMSGLTIDVLRRALGAPNSIRTRLVPGSDDRSEIWVLYGYGGDAVKFVESNYGARLAGGRRRIDRALLSPGIVMRAMETPGR